MSTVLDEALDTKLSPLDVAAKRVDEAIAAAQKLEPEARKAAFALRDALLDFHRLGLRRMIEAMKRDDAGKRLLFQLIDESEVHALMASHGLVRADAATRVREELARIRPYLEEQHIQLEVASITRERVELIASGTGCTSTIGPLEEEIAECLKQCVPELVEVSVKARAPEPKLIPISALMAAPVKQWHRGPRLDEVTEGRGFAFDAAGRNLLAVRFGAEVQVFINVCPHQGLALDRGLIDCEARTLTCPWHGFRFDAVEGECLTAPGVQLQRFESRVRDGFVEVDLS